LPSVFLLCVPLHQRLVASDSVDGVQHALVVSA
jgi:hypothetical protein